jgi:Fe-S-cluster containining protein
MAKTEKKRLVCIRCGECCVRSTPALHGPDLPLLVDKILELQCLITIREGQPVYDNLAGTARPAPGEFVKIANLGPGAGCVFHAPERKACSVYKNRPLECRAQKCWDEQEMRALMGRDMLRREHILAGQTELLEFIWKHGRRVSWPRLGPSLRAFWEHGETDAQARVIEVLEADVSARRELRERFGKTTGEEMFFLGAPVQEVLRSIGIRVREVGDRMFLRVLARDR